MCCKGCISFNFSILVIIYTTYRKKNYTHLLPKRLKIFLYTTYIFHLNFRAEDRENTFWNTELRAMKTVVAGAVGANCGKS